MSRRIVIGVMGAGEGARAEDVALAERLGEALARQGWVVLTGGRPAGVMAAAVRGAKRVPGSLAVGILPSEGGPVAPGLDLAVFTGFGHGRNIVNVLSSRVVITCGQLGAGTLSEAALAIKSGRPLILLAPDRASAVTLTALSADVRVVASVEDALGAVSGLLAAGQASDDR